MLKNPGTAAVLSFLIPGLGQIHNGNFIQGFVHIAVSVFGAFMIFEGSFPASFYVPVILGNIGIACVTAYTAAEDYNRAVKSLDEYNKAVQDREASAAFSHDKKTL